jgi:spore coat polysaccharide biosynthesis protein SpsF (cytidylyltransferase family)
LRTPQQRAARINSYWIAVLVCDDVVVRETSDVPVAEPRICDETVLKLGQVFWVCHLLAEV